MSLFVLFYNINVVVGDFSDLRPPSNGAFGSIPSNFNNAESHEHHIDKHQRGTMDGPSGYEYNDDKHCCSGTKDSEPHIFKLSSVENIAKKCIGANYEELIKYPIVTHIAICKSPLEALYSKSPSVIKENSPNQYTTVDYHAFVVLKTNIGIYLTLEKSRDSIYISNGTLKNGPICELSASTRNLPVEHIIEDECKYALSELIELFKEEDTREYKLTRDNCQHFAKRIFDKVARFKYWEPVTAQEYIFYWLFLFFIIIIIIFSIFIIIFIRRDKKNQI